MIQAFETHQISDALFFGEAATPCNHVVKVLNQSLDRFLHEHRKLRERGVLNKSGRVRQSLRPFFSQFLSDEFRIR